MTEETQASDSQPEVQTLDDVISEFNPKPAEPTPAEPAPAASGALESKLNELTSQLTELQQRQAQDQLDKDLNGAIDYVKTKGGIDLDNEIVESYLEVKARKNPGLKSIWENRSTNPEALQKALDAIANEMSSKFSLKQDPELTKAQRAMKSAQTANSSAGGPSTLTERLADMTPEQRAKEWDRLRNSG